MKKILALFAALVLFVGIGAAADDGAYLGADYEFGNGTGVYFGYQWNGPISEFALDFGFTDVLTQTRSDMVFSAHYDADGAAGEFDVDLVLELDGDFVFQSIDFDGRYDTVLWPRYDDPLDPYDGAIVSAYVEAGLLFTALPGVPVIDGALGFLVEF